LPQKIVPGVCEVMLMMPVYLRPTDHPPFVMEDFDDVHTLFDVELDAAALHVDKMQSLAERAEWLRWSALNHVQLAKLYQPPYGDRAVQLKVTGELIGACGYVPCLAPFEQIPYFGGARLGGSETCPYLPCPTNKNYPEVCSMPSRHVIRDRASPRRRPGRWRITLSSSCT
jgi:hypothetical protein